jgi:hypothetical protein
MYLIHLNLIIYTFLTTEKEVKGKYQQGAAREVAGFT